MTLLRQKKICKKLHKKYRKKPNKLVFLYNLGNCKNRRTKNNWKYFSKQQKKYKIRNKFKLFQSRPLHKGSCAYV